jgi:hypothetical protein
MSDLARVRAAYERYVEARNTLLDELHLGRRSNRDPLAEFSEWLVAALVGGTLADSPVQKGWDVMTPAGEKIQVKYLANSTDDSWANEHKIEIKELMDSYAIVIFEALLPQAIIIFPVRNLAAIGTKLGKRHGNLDTTLQFTRTNYLKIRQDTAGFSSLGVRLYLPPDWVLM